MTTQNNTELINKLETTLRNSIHDLTKAKLLIDLDVKVTYDDIGNLLEYPNVVKLLIENDMLTLFAYSMALGYYPGKGNLELTKIITEKYKFNQNLLDAASCSAAANGHLEVIKYLHNTYTIDMDMAFANAAFVGNLEIVKYFIDKGINVNANDSIAFINSATENNIAITKLLIDKGAKVDAQNGKALFNSAIRGNIDMVNLLLDNGADIHINGMLKKCVEYGRLEMVKLLLSRGAKVDFTYSSDNTDMSRILNNNNDMQKLQEENNMLKKKLADIKAILN